MSELLPDYVPPTRTAPSAIVELADGGWARVDGDLYDDHFNGAFAIYRWMVEWQLAGRSVRGLRGPLPPEIPGGDAAR